MAELDTMVTKLKAAGEPTRLRLLALLAEGDLSVKDLTEILGQSQPRVSRHLKLLADADLVVRNPEGAWAYYGLNADGPRLAQWLIDQLAEGDTQRVRDRARLERVRAQQQAQAASYFAKVADSWDLLRSLHVPEAAVEAAILELVGDRRVDLLVDLGTGTGRMIELLADRCRRAIGIDSSREMLAIARAKLAAAGIAHAQVRLGDIAAMEDAVGPADLIVIHQVLHYFDDPGRVLVQAARMLRPDGRMIVVDFAPHLLEFLRTDHAHRRLGLGDAQMAAWARAAGLDVQSAKALPGNGDLTVCVWTLTAPPTVGRRK
jgi:ArsR family transcriptional regulator